MRVILPLERRFWQALLMCPLLLIILGIERQTAWLDGNAARDKSALIAGIHPASFYFADRSQLVGAKADGATLTLAPQGGYNVQPTSEHISFSLALSQPLNPADVWLMMLNVAPLITNPRPKLKFALVLQESATQSAQSPAWISELVPGEKGELALTDALFRNTASSNAPQQSWTSLPASRYLRLYIHAPTRKPFLLKSLWFRLDPAALKRMQAQLDPAGSLHFGQLAPAGLVGFMLIWTLSLIPVWRGLNAGSHSAPFGLAALVFLPGFVMLSWVWGFSVPGPFDLNAHDALADFSASVSVMRFSPIFLTQLLGIAWLLGALVLALRYASFSGKISAEKPAAAQNWLVLLGALAGAIIIIVAAGLPNSWPSPERLLAYLGFALLQQFLLQRVLLRALLDSFSQSFAILLAALMFALWHSPNITLMLACFVSAIYGCSLHIRGVDWRRLALLHALLGTLLVMCFPTSVLKNAEVGSRHFTMDASVR
jgi:hypothetical protein